MSCNYAWRWLNHPTCGRGVGSVNRLTNTCWIGDGCLNLLSSKESKVLSKISFTCSLCTIIKYTKHKLTWCIHRCFTYVLFDVIQSTGNIVPLIDGWQRDQLNEGTVLQVTTIRLVVIRGGYISPATIKL